MQKYSEELNNKIVELYKAGKSPYWMVENIEELKNKRPSVIYGILKRNNITTNRIITLTDKQRKGRRKYNLNDDYFETIDTEHKAYWLGFMYADGYINSLEDKVGITISKYDIEILENFKKDLEASSPIKTYIQNQGYNIGTEYIRILLSSNKLKNDLIKHGVVKHKTDKIKFPTTVPDNLINHFVRGYFDGDGCITYGAKQKCGKYNFNIKIVGTKEFLNEVQKYLRINRTMHQRFPERNINNWTLTIGGNNVVKRVMNYLYENSTIYLERKHNKYLELLNQ